MPKRSILSEQVFAENLSAQCRVPVDWYLDFSQCLFEWQGIVGAVLAMLAAGASIIVLRAQIAQSEKHEKNRLRRQQNSARATLPLTLSGIGERLRAMLLALRDARLQLKTERVVDVFELPDVPSEHIAELQAVIATTDEPSVVEPISEIIREIQTLWARVDVLTDTREQRRNAGLEINIEEWIIQTAKIHALIESLFEYARQKSDLGPSAVGWNRAESIIFRLGMESGSLVETIKKGLEKSPDFWTLKNG
jgi:hypothetical protein